MASVTSMLTSIGIGAPPASVSDAKKAAQDQKAAVGDLTNAVSGMKTSLSLLTATGAPASVTGPIKDNLASGNALLANASSMTPAELTKKTAQIQSQHEIDTMNHANTMRAKDIEELTAAEKDVTQIVKNILADARASQNTRDSCTRLLTEIQDAKRAISNAVFTKEENTLGSSLTSGSVLDAPLKYTRPNVLTPEDIKISINIIQDGYDDETDNNLGKLNRKGTNLYITYVWPVIFFSLFAFCVIVAGIVSSNACLPNELYSAYNRVYYFIYGSILFPITLPVYGVFYPPEWYSTICPLYSNDGTRPLVPDLPDGTESVLSSVSSLLSSPSSFMSSFFGGGDADPAGGTAAADDVPALKGVFYYFYPLVKNPVAKSNLTIMSLIATVLVWGYLFISGSIELISQFTT
jgi:hypothetical protein